MVCRERFIIRSARRVSANLSEQPGHLSAAGEKKWDCRYVPPGNQESLDMLEEW